MTKNQTTNPEKLANNAPKRCKTNKLHNNLLIWRKNTWPLWFLTNWSFSLLKKEIKDCHTDVTWWHYKDSRPCSCWVSVKKNLKWCNRGHPLLSMKLSKKCICWLGLNCSSVVSESICVVSSSKLKQLNQITVRMPL